MTRYRKWSRLGLIAMCLCLILLSITVTGYGQGAGRSIPQPSPKPRSTQRVPQSPSSTHTPRDSARLIARVTSLAGTSWAFRDSHGSRFVYEFLSEGKIRFRNPNGNSGEGTWIQTGRQVVIQFEADNSRETGVITGNRMSGTGHGTNIGSYKWTANRTR